MSLAMMQFDNRLFQRGLTWEECLASWEPDRASFLQDATQTPPLPRLHALLSRLDMGRVIVIFHANLLDSRRSIPIVGKALAALPQLETRYFSMEHFFPLLQPVFGRKLPRVCLLDQHGKLASVWGPRPESLTKTWEAKASLPAEERDTWLWSIENEEYAAEIDASLTSTLKDAVHSQLTDSPTVPY